MTRGALPSLSKPYAAERHLDLTSIQVAFCERCPKLGRRTELVFGTDAIGRTTTRCPRCDGVAPRRAANPNEVLRPQALISAAQLLPPCPPGVLRCQSCARPVVGDARLCPKCELPGLKEAREAPAESTTSVRTRPCPGCGAPTIVRRGPPPKTCEACG